MTKKNKDLISEELNRHMSLVEYTFYVGEDDDITGKNPKEKDLLLDRPTLEADDEEVGLGDEEGFGDEAPTEEPIEDPALGDAGQDPALGDEPMEEPMAEPEAPITTEPLAQMAPAEDEVELDVTQLVQGTEEAKMSADMANEKMAALMGQFAELNMKLNKLEDLDNKIEDLEQEVIERNPTDVEKLEMRSLDSFPYNMKLTDYWSEKEGAYDVMDTDVEGDEAESEEYVLTKQDVENEFNGQEVQQTFDKTSDEEDELDKFKMM